MPPPPGDIVKLAEHTVRGVVTKVTTTGGLTKAPATTPDREPGTTPRLGLGRHPARVGLPAADDSFALPVLSARPALYDLLPSLPTGLAGPAVRTPVLAGSAGTSASPSYAQNAAQSDDLATPGGGVMRAILIALSAAAAATLAVAHVTVARGSRR